MVLYYLNNFDNEHVVITNSIFQRELADINSDGKLDFVEFSIACKLINAKLRGFDLPKVLPLNLRNSATAGLTSNYIMFCYKNDSSVI